MIAPSGVPSLVHAATPHDQNVGQWDYTCRVDQINAYETITIGSDTHGPLATVLFRYRTVQRISPRDTCRL